MWLSEHTARAGNTTGRSVQDPAGIDPGFHHNPGKVDFGREAADRLVAKINATPEIGRAAIGQPWRTSLFRRFLEGRPGVDWPVEVVSPRVLAATGGRSRTVRLSGDTAAKQIVRHGELQFSAADGETSRKSPRRFIPAWAGNTVEDLRAAVDKAIAEGTTLATFRKDFDGIFARHGWSYTGGRTWRTRVIYDTNIRSPYAAGRYRQMKEGVDRRPWWRYRHSHASENPREHHLAWDGMVLRHDDPWWDTHFPINGWGCKCYVAALNGRDLERLGKEGPDTAPPLNMRTVTVGQRGPSPRTVEVPEGIDPGFGYAPGRSASPAFVREAAPLLGERPLFRRFLEEAGPGPSFPVAALDDMRVVLLSGETAAKQRLHHPELEAAGYSLVQFIIDEGELFAERQGISFQGFAHDGDGRLWKAVVKSARAESYFLTLHRTKERDLRASQRRLKRLEREN